MQDVFTFVDGVDSSTVQATVSLTRGLQDSFTPSDQIAVNKIRGRLLSDTFTFTENLTRDIDVAGRILQDVFVLAENFLRDSWKDRTLQESFTYADQIVFTRQLLRLLADSNILTDSMLRDLDIDRLLFDSNVLSENLDYTSTGAPSAVADEIHWRLWPWHKWADRRRIIRDWMKRTYYPPQ